MATYVLTDTPDDGEVKANQNGDGTANFWAETLIPFWSQFCAVKQYLRADSSIDLTKSLSSYTTGNGATLIGMPATAIGGWSGGTLFDFLEAAFTAIFALDGAKLPLAGGVMTGAITFRAPANLPNTATHTMTLAYEFANIPDVTQVSVYTAPNPSSEGRWFFVRRKEFANSNVARVVRANGDILASFPASGFGAALFVSESDGGGGFRWTCFSATGVAAAVN